jgi:transcriptional regulator with PAS, ATPase and Fis domain
MKALENARPLVEYLCGEYLLEAENPALTSTLEAISSLVGLDMSLIDTNLRRLASTGCYRNTWAGMTLPSTCASARALSEGRPLIINRPGDEEACSTCPDVSECMEKAVILHPIVVDGQAVAVMAIGAFTETQRRVLMEKPGEVLHFSGEISRLLWSHIREAALLEPHRAFLRQLEVLMDESRDGIAIVDDSAQVCFTNRTAMSMFNLRLGQRLNLPKDIQDGREHALGTGKSRFLAKVWQIQANSRWAGALLLVRSHPARSDPGGTLESFIGNSSHTERLRQRARRAALTDCTVLITGESGTGKEVLARAIHAESARARGRFVALNCAAIPETLLESELFGYEEGAFTGARRGGKAGLLEAASGGTLFLDEIADMPLGLQAKILRAMESAQNTRLGSVQETPLDVRILAATNRPLEEEIRKGHFREDLYYRLNVISLYIPPLRERPDDTDCLLDHFVRLFGEAMHKPVVQVSGGVEDLLLGYSWPGNVRELMNCVRHMLAFMEGETLEVQYLPDRIRESAAPRHPATLQEALEMAEGDFLKRALEGPGGPKSMSEMAKALGLSRATLYRKLERHGLSHGGI